ncbi:hypothetical protein CCYA_CCYA01G0435 [Cyanidiococcus yangmingshanensis]|nr:hypothetical protein CCYA_CCYA01G0435 [Cyanidiococcus yangmingshanensis]
MPAKVRRSDPAASVATTSSVVLRIPGAEVFERDGLCASEEEEQLVQQVIRAVAAHRAAVERLQSLKDQPSHANIRREPGLPWEGSTASAAGQVSLEDSAEPAAASSGSSAISTGADALLVTGEHERIWSEEVASLLKQRRPYQHRQTRWCRTPDDFIAMLLRACVFAARKHRNQRRKDVGRTPYINHALDVAHALWTDGHIRDGRVILAGILCHAVGDASATVHGSMATTSGETTDDLDDNDRDQVGGNNPDSSQTLAESVMEIEKEFGVEVASIVRECWDEKRMLNRFLAEQAMRARLDEHLGHSCTDSAAGSESAATIHAGATEAGTATKTRSLWSRLFAGGYAHGALDSSEPASSHSIASKNHISGMMKGRSRGRSSKLVAPLTRMDRKKIESICSLLKSKEAKMVRMADKLVNLREILVCEQGRPHGWSLQRTEEYFAWADAMQHRIGSACPALAKAIDKVVKTYRAQQSSTKIAARPPMENTVREASKVSKLGNEAALVLETPDARLVLARDISHGTGGDQLDKENWMQLDRKQSSPLADVQGGNQHPLESSIPKNRRPTGSADSANSQADTSSFTVGVLDTPARRGVLLELRSEEPL